MLNSEKEKLSNYALRGYITKQNSSKLIFFLQAFGIILVVIGHANISGTWLRTWIYEFHMPLFMFISGFLMKYSLKTDYEDVNLCEFIKKKLYRLLIPYFVINIIALYPKILMNDFASRPVEVSWFGIIQSFIYPWDNTIIFFWFLPTLFLIFVISASLLKLFKSDIPIIILMAVSIVCQIFNLEFTKFLNINGVIIYFSWWGFGYFYMIYEAKMKLMVDSHCLAFICFLGTLIPIYTESTENFMYIFSILGILLSLHLGYYSVEKGHKFLDFLNGYSYSIYLFSWFPQVAVRIICIQLISFPFPLVFVLSSVFGIFIPILIAKLGKAKLSNKFFKYVFGI